VAPAVPLLVRVRYVRSAPGGETMAEGNTKDWEYKLVDVQGGKEYTNTSADFSGAGKASITFEDGRVETYEGEYYEQVRYGHGVYKYHNGDVYTGSWQGGNKAGIGQLLYAEAAAEGEGEGEGAPSRKGKYYGHYGGSSAGEHAENVRHGDGSFTYHNGDTYCGQWVRGKKQGQGTYCFKEDQTRLVGVWQDGKLVTGKWVFPNGVYYIGKFENGKPNGEGNWVFKSGTQICGTYTQKPKEGQEEAGEGEEKKDMLVDAEWASTSLVSVLG